MLAYFLVNVLDLRGDFPVPPKYPSRLLCISVIVIACFGNVIAGFGGRRSAVSADRDHPIGALRRVGYVLLTDVGRESSRPGHRDWPRTVRVRTMGGKTGKHARPRSPRRSPDTDLIPAPPWPPVPPGLSSTLSIDTDALARELVKHLDGKATDE